MALGMNKTEIFEIIKKYKQENETLFGITDMGVFDSVAKDLFDQESDVDVYVSTITPNPFILVEIKENLEKLLHRKVDIIRYREHMNNYLKQHILNEGISV